MTSKSYSGSITPAVTYCYDALPSSPGVCSGGQAAGYQGRLTKVFTAAAGPIPATSFDIPSYDGAGRPASSQETVGALAAYRFNSYQYNLQDALTSLTYPSGRVVSYGRDSSGRVSSVSSGTTAYASNVQYWGHGPSSR